jgi:metal-responsive CopG/Arc/MetJ family transcriptional regulator
MDPVKITQLRLPAPLYEAVRERAYAGRKSRNQFMVEAIRKEIEGKTARAVYGGEKLEG